MQTKPLSRIENMQLGNPLTPPALRSALQARADAIKAEGRLEQARAAAARVLPPEDVDRRGRIFRDHQARVDAQLVGRAGSSASTSRDPEVRAAAQRLRAKGEQRDAAAAVEAATHEHAGAVRLAASLEADLAAAAHRNAVDAKEAELAQATAQLRASPLNGELVEQVRKLGAEVEALITQQPTK